MIKKLLLILFPPLIIFIAWVFLRSSPFALLESDGLHMSAFTDKGIDAGRSEIIDVEDASGYKAITFELNKGFISPYAGISFFEDDYWDLSDYDKVQLELELENTKNLELSIATYQDGITKENEPLSFRHNVIEIPISDKTRIYQLELERMHTAQWWLERFKVRSTELGAANWEKTKAISFVAKIRLDNTKPQILKVSKITFKNDLTWFYIAAGVFAILWYAAVFMYFRLSQSDKTDPELVIRYRQMETPVKPAEEGNEIFDYISENYSDPDLSLGKLSDKLKMPEKAISGAIKNRYNLTFKEYVNGIRLTEAKRLLKNSDRTVSEIAYQVGFNSPNHFNRTFKSSEGCTPTEFKTGS